MKGLLKRGRTLLCNVSYAKLFAATVLTTGGLYLLVSLLSGGRLFSSIFFAGGYDCFMDFFNSVRDASLGPGVYTERGVIYPPMANLIFWLLSFLLPARYTSTDFEHRLSWQSEPAAVLLITLASAVGLLLLGLLGKILPFFECV